MSSRDKLIGTCTNCGHDIFVSRYSSRPTSLCAECELADGERQYEAAVAECPQCGSEVDIDGLCVECEAKRQEIRALDKMNAEASMKEADNEEEKDVA